MYEREISALAADFWDKAGVGSSFPRALEPAVFIVLPLAVVRLPRLRQRAALRWLKHRGVMHTLHATVADSRLHGYLVARNGAGIVFLSGTDPLDEQLFSLAHEIAHFLCDYWEPRLAAIRDLGVEIVPVLDGRRAPTPEERLAGVLRGVPVGTFSHLGRQLGRSIHPEAEALHVEDRADQLALELLAPLADVLRALRRRGSLAWTSEPRDAVATLLRQEFGLPVGVADTYAHVVASAWRSRRSFRDWLEG